MRQSNSSGAAVDMTGPGAATSMVRAGALRKYAEFVTQLGGDAQALLAKFQIDPAALANRHAVVAYRAFVQLLERTAVELACPDFGMRLAAVQDGTKVLGPLEVAMRNSATVGAAFRYCAEHVRAYSTATQVSLEERPGEEGIFLHCEILVPKLPPHPQTMEHGLLLTQHAARQLSGGQMQAREIWFTHDPVSPMGTYRANFGAVVKFGQPMNGAWFDARDFEAPIPDSDPQLYELAASFIEQRFPSSEPGLSTRVRAIVERLLTAGGCTYGGVASELGMHPRTLQRRLRTEGESFEAIKDSVRRDVALRYLRQPEIPLIRVAEMLGYSETSVLSRSCYRWFAASPRQLRAGARVDAAEVG
ncbi:AraC family transcriptional regulator [Phenylobacterium sp. LjRoot219]|uniref:AraC family transcriptional regulator n=1 Tax=Phenylobacterium sp. LjRoot219 TaxID=3342283 RepID=UPI003ECE1A8B